MGLTQVFLSNQAVAVDMKSHQVEAANPFSGHEAMIGEVLSQIEENGGSFTIPVEKKMATKNFAMLRREGDGKLLTQEAKEKGLKTRMLLDNADNNSYMGKLYIGTPA